MPLTTSSLNALRGSFSKYMESLGADVSRQALDKIFDGIRSITQPGQEDRGGALPVEVGMNPATVRGSVLDLLKRFENPQALAEELNLDFKISVATDVTRGAAIFAKEAADADVVEAYPAWELLRVYDRDVPRGYRQINGTLIPVPGDDWPTRFRAAAQASGDTDAASVLQATGRMIAFKASPIWQALGDGEGGYTDTLRNPYAPFAFNSGYDLNNVGRVECIELGLLQPGQTAPVADVDLNNLFAPIEVAA